MLSALFKLNDLEHKFITQQSQLQDNSEKNKQLENRLKMQEKKHTDKIKELEEQCKNARNHAGDIDKIKSDLAEGLVKQIQEVKKMSEIQEKKHVDNVDKIKADHAEDRRNIEKIKTDHDKDMRNIEKKYTEEIKMLGKSLSTKQPITPVVGFHVALSKIWSGSGKVPFDKIISNYGHGWDRITHVFNVPTKGLYFLILTVMNGKSSYAHSWLMHGSTRVAHAYADGGHSYNMGTVATVLLLDAGEHVYAHAQNNGGILHSHSPNHYTYLAGFLIQKSD